MGRPAENTTESVEKGSVFSDTISFFTSVKTTLGLLFLLAGASIVGTVVPQGATPAQLRETASPFVYRLIVILDLNDVYGSWWFLTLLTLLAINLLACLLQRTPSILAQWRDSGRKASINLTIEDSRSPADIKPIVRDAVTRVVKSSPAESSGSDEVTLSWVKHRFHLLGFPTIHIAIVVILLGGLLGLLFGFRGHVLIREGAAADRFVLGESRETKPLPFTIKVDEFSLTRYPSGQPKEYRSDVRIIDNGREVLKDSILVNHPLTYKGISIYQSDYRMAGVESVEFTLIGPEGTERSVSVDPQEEMKLPGEDFRIRLLSLHPGDDLRGAGVEAAVEQPGEEPKPIRLYEKDPEPLQLGAWRIRLTGYTPLYATGLQIGYDPGTAVVWIGCILLITGLGIALFANHRRIRVRISPRGAGSEIAVTGNCKSRRKEFRTALEEELRTALNG